MKIRKDVLGLYGKCDGYIIRPFYGTVFKEGDDVKARHLRFSKQSMVTRNSDNEIYNFKRNGMYEYWENTFPTHEYNQYKKELDKKDFESMIKSKTGFGDSRSIFCDHNKKFK